MSMDIEKIEAMIYERYISFQKLIARLIHENFEIRSSKTIHEKAQNIYKSLQTGLTILSVGGLAIRSGDSESHWYCCFSLAHQKQSDKIRSGINAINQKIQQSIPNGITRYSTKIDENEINFVITPINDDVLLIIDPYYNNRKYNIEIIPLMLWHPVAASFRELIRQYRKSSGWWYRDADIQIWQDVEQGITAGVKVQDPLRGKNSFNTITLTLDLRKSTFAMEQAKDHSIFAEWMRKLILKMSSKTKESGATFDKFTGDGVIIHFRIWPESERDSDQNIVLVRALRCAADLIGVVNNHLPELRKNLHNDSGKFGAGVGMAMAEAQWDVDDYGHFMVVGRGVVGACRAADGAPAGCIRLVNSAYQPLCDVPNIKTDKFRREKFNTKDFKEELDVPVWEIDADDVPSAIINCKS